MKNLLLSVGLIICFSTAFAQSYEPIQNPRGAVFIQNGRKLMPRQLLEITQINPEAYKEMQKAKSNYDVGSVIGFVGGFMVGYPLGTAIGGGEPNWTLAGIGAGLIVVSIPLSTSYTKHARNAVNIYNNGLNKPIAHTKEVRLQFSQDGLGIKISL